MPLRPNSCAVCVPLLALAAFAASCAHPAGHQPSEDDAGSGSRPPEQPFFANPPAWRPIYQGIEYAELAYDKPRAMAVQLLRIDTEADGLEIITTPSNGDEPLETNAQTTRQFLEEHDLSVAINTHFFDPCCSRVLGEDKNLVGLSIAQSEVVSPASDASQPDAIFFTRRQDSDTPAIKAFPWPATMFVSFKEDPEVSHAIAGRMVLDDGEVFNGDDRLSTELHPRTLVGLSESARYIYLVTIDGRQPGFSTGASLAEAASIMYFVGARHALNVDGGGSTTMIIRDAEGASQLANSPSDGAERYVGSNLGLRAVPLQPKAGAGP